MSKTAPQDLARILDQFYTNVNYAKHFYKIIQDNVNLEQYSIQLEPSAGTGSFFNLMDKNKRVGLDLDPKSTDIQKYDFFSWKPDSKQTVITIGNPPFGKNSSLAVKFFNHAAQFSDVIAFILPRTFRKTSIVNRLNKNFHLIYDELVPDYSFIFNDKPYNVWCCAQIWIKKPTARKKIPILRFNDFDKWFSIVEPESADFSIQRVGGKAGLIRKSNFSKYSKESHFFIKQNYTWVIDVFEKIDFETVKYNTASNPSISPSEMLQLWKQKAQELELI